MTVMAAVHGCIPVIMQDGIHQPFEDVLPYANFAIRIAEADISELPDMLTAVASDKERLSRMQVRHWMPSLRRICLAFVVKRAPSTTENDGTNE